MRLFIAIQMNEEAKQAIEDVQEVFRWQNIQGKYIPRENLHVTLPMKIMKTNMIKTKDLLRGVVAKTKAELREARIANNSKKVQRGNNK